MAPELPYITQGKFAITRKNFVPAFAIMVLVFGVSLGAQVILSDEKNDWSWESRVPYHLTFACISLVALASGAITYSLRDRKGHLMLTHDRLQYTLGKKYRFDIPLSQLHAGSRFKETFTLKMKDGTTFTMELPSLQAHQVGSYLTLYLRFRNLVPRTVWKRFSLEDYYTVKEYHERTVRMFLYGPIRAYVDCGWLVTLKQTTYFFPFPWPASYGKQDTKFVPPPGFPRFKEVVPQAVSVNLHLLLKAVLVSPIPSYQKEFILSTMSMETGGGPLFGPLYHFFRPTRNQKNGLVYMNVPLMWAQHVRQPELQ
jgi:hypothetical protein